MQKIILLGVFVGLCAAVPVLYESNPDAIENLMRNAVQTPQQEGGLVAAPTRPVEPAAPQQQSLSSTAVRLTADQRGHFNAEFRLNGRPIEAMVDTGATLVAINETTARRIGIDLALSDFVHEVDTANGRARAAAAIIDRLEIGRIEVRNVQAVVLEDGALSGTLIGMSFLSRLQRFAMEDGALVLEL